VARDWRSAPERGGSCLPQVQQIGAALTRGAAPFQNGEVTGYYSNLGPFRRLFESGLPILMYHKLGPRPRKVRLKGLYLSKSLFTRQLAELRASGFNTVRIGVPIPATGTNRSVVITFDDGFLNVLKHGLEPLAVNRFSAVQFLVANRLGGQNDWDIADGEAHAPLMSLDQVREWLAAGHWIGSHSLSHPWLTQIPMPQAREEIRASKRKLEDLFGVSVDDFCYPYGDWNPEVRDLVIEAGYRTACTTQSGINAPNADLFSLQRFSARYPSRNLKDIWARLWGTQGRSSM